jgi:FtsZ-interacting cell division protein ZipA
MVDEFAAMLGLDVFQLSVIIIIIAVIIIAVSIIVNIFVTRKSREEAVAKGVLKNVKLIQKGKLKPKTNEEVKKEEKIVKNESKKAKNEGVSMKEHLSKKFKPKIEKQLKTKINLLDFTPKGKDFNALIEVGGVKVLLVLDPSGKIIDYKKK